MPFFAVITRFLVENKYEGEVPALQGSTPQVSFRREIERRRRNEGVKMGRFWSIKITFTYLNFTGISKYYEYMPFIKKL